MVKVVRMGPFSRVRPLSILASVCIAVGCLTACGGGTSGDVVARVGSTAITKTDVNHWMSTLAGGDYYELSRMHTLPGGLVSDPANYAACVASLETAAGSAGAGQAKPPASQLLSKCRQLYHAIRQQAVAYLVEVQWIIGLAGDEGVKASDQDVKRLFDQIKKQEFPTERKLRRFLASNRRSLADEMFVVKLDVLREKLSKKATAGGKQTQLKFFEDGRRWTAKTTCQAGYVVPHCKQYKGEPAPTRDASPAILMEQVATMTGSAPCTNRPACG